MLIFPIRFPHYSAIARPKTPAAPARLRTMPPVAAGAPAVEVEVPPVEVEAPDNVLAVDNGASVVEGMLVMLTDAEVDAGVKPVDEAVVVARGVNPVIPSEDAHDTTSAGKLLAQAG